MSVQEIKAAVQHPSLEERAEVAACLHSWSDDVWDEQMKRDSASGRLDKILGQVDADIEENKLRGLLRFRGRIGGLSGRRSKSEG